jgi:nicotinamide-nucleotide amidase
MQAEILAIGDEITGGQLLDTNSQWLSQRLGELGIRVLYHSTVGDELEPCVAVFRQAIERADIVIATGGLGPTADDLTREALAQAVGRPLELVPEALEHIRQLFARRNREMPQRNELQAMFPKGSRVVPNPHGTAPGIDIEIPREGRNACRFIALPGVPAELHEMWQGTVREALRAMGAGLRFIVRRNIKCFGAGESQIESLLPDLIRRDHIPRVGITASRATITLRIMAEGMTAEDCYEQIDATEAKIFASLGNLVYGEGNDELQDVVVRLLQAKDKTLAVVEMATAGLVTQLIGSAATAHKACLRGGLVVSDEPSAAALLAPNGKGVAALAQACRTHFGADLALAVGEFPTEDLSETEAGEEADSESVNVGKNVENAKTVQIALASSAGMETIEFNCKLHPDIVLIYCAKRAMDLVRLTLLKS